MSKIAAAIIEGRTHIVEARLAAGLDPSTFLKLGRDPALAMLFSPLQRRLARTMWRGNSWLRVRRRIPPILRSLPPRQRTKGDVALTVFLIDHRASVGTMEPSGKTALENALAQSQLEMVKLR